VPIVDPLQPSVGSNAVVAANLGRHHSLTPLGYGRLHESTLQDFFGEYKATNAKVMVLAAG
jgi:hypothetical protein